MDKKGMLFSCNVMVITTMSFLKSFCYSYACVSSSRNLSLLLLLLFCFFNFFLIFIGGRIGVPHNAFLKGTFFFFSCYLKGKFLKKFDYSLCTSIFFWPAGEFSCI